MEERTYAIPFDRVWREALALASAGMPRWSVDDADDGAGRIEASVRRVLGRRTDAVRVRVGLDADAQTRVAVEWTGTRRVLVRGGRRRSARRFLRRLDEGLARPAPAAAPRAR